MNTSEIRYYKFSALLQQQGWLKPAFAGLDDRGILTYLSDLPPSDNVPVENVDGVAIPGFQNAHSHAFQYAMAGMAEKHRPGTKDDFWSWREAMYQCALSVDPDQMESIAAMLYAEMLRYGYTHVAEFHYLHHDKSGKPYDHLAEMGERLVSAAATAGIKITLVPVFYQQGGFGLDPLPSQRRFISQTTEEYFILLEASKSVISNYDNASLGFGVHSLRAVKPEDVIRTFEYGPKNLPFHLHASEQLKEVSESLSFLKQRPVEWLLNQLPLCDRFNMVHCTHLDDEEVKRLAKSQANVILCPGTEGNLGDGIFRLGDYSAHYGNWTIGTDSQISLNPLEDLRWLDYGQRLVTHKRNTFDEGAPVFLNKVIPCGRKAMGYSTENFFDVGQPMDAVVYRGSSPLLQQAMKDNLLSAIMYTADSACIYGTMVNGNWVVRDNHSNTTEAIRKRFFTTIHELRK